MRADAEIVTDEKTGDKRLVVTFPGSLKQMRRDPEWCAKLVQENFARYIVGLARHGGGSD